MRRSPRGGRSTIVSGSRKAPSPTSRDQGRSLAPAPNVRLNGRLVWDEDRTVRGYSPFAGRVMRIAAQPGDTVRKGQTLAVLGSPEFGQAQADVRRAETDL